MAKQDYLIKLSVLQEEARRMQEQVQLVNQETADLEIVKTGVDKLGEEKSEEILAPVGKGIFIKSKPLEKELFVNVGKGIVLKKTPKEAVKIIDKQIKQLQELKQVLVDEIEKINIQLQDLIVQAQKEQEEKS